MSKRRRWKKARPPSLDKQISYLMDDVCVGLGFCSLPRGYWQSVARAEPLSARLFAHDVLLAEGMAPDQEEAGRSAIEARFRRHFGDALDLGSVNE
ncbi:MAG: hypothetical protein AAF495_28835 [Pseudomonadota bacterium]